jgi:hypothetical protein
VLHCNRQEPVPDPEHCVFLLAHIMIQQCWCRSGVNVERKQKDMMCEQIWKGSDGVSPLIVQLQSQYIFLHKINYGMT